MKSLNTRYLIGLDHLRAFAALLIVFYHGLHVLSFTPRAAGGEPLRFWITSMNPAVVLVEEGHTAVALFLVLSGFVFSVSALGREINYFGFLRNRFLRIYPLFVLVIAVGLAAYPGQYSLLAVLQTLLFQTNYPGALAVPPFSSMFWAVGLEFQFYLLFPFLHRFVERYGVRWVFATIALLWGLRLFASVSSTPRDVSYWHGIGRIDQFMIGMVTARLFSRFERLNFPWGRLCLLAFAIMLGLLTFFNQQGGYPSAPTWKIVWPTVEACGWAFVLLTYTLFARGIPSKIARPIARVGLISYSIYLLHYSCLTLLPRWFSHVFSSDPDLNSQLYVAFVVLPILLPFAALSYYAIERPFLNMRGRYFAPLRPAVLVGAESESQPQLLKRVDG